MRHEDVGRRGTTGTIGQVRGNALWGDGKRTLAVTLAALLVVGVALLAGRIDHAQAAKGTAFVPQALLDAASGSPDAVFDVIIAGTRETRSKDVAADVNAQRKDTPGNGVGVKRIFSSISGASAQLTGRQILKLADKSHIRSIVLDTEIGLTAYSNNQIWPAAATVTNVGWATPPTGTTFPTIAIVDSGVQSRTDFGSRLLTSVKFVSNSTSSAYYGHGTLVASMAAGGASGYAGAEPHANFVSLKVIDGNGVGSKSDVIAACDWILANKNAYNIRVANFSLNATGESVLYDPLDAAVEKLWLNGVTVVVAAGNYAIDGARSDVGYAPANDPFVITVGASDINSTTDPSDDFPAPWSAWGYTQDGFFKPEIAAPGRVMNGAVPNSSTLLSQFPSRQVGFGTYPYMWMSGTSFAAPVISGIAATILSRHPSWTPDEVKGAIMASASVPAGYGSNAALGVGVVNGNAAAGQPGIANPNAGLNQFVYYDSTTGLYDFDANQWSSVAYADASWSSASWANASWANASWSSASWSSASWSSASWANASWANASWANASWANASWANAYDQP